MFYAALTKIKSGHPTYDVILPQHNFKNVIKLNFFLKTYSINSCMSMNSIIKKNHITVETSVGIESSYKATVHFFEKHFFYTFSLLFQK